MARYDFGGVAEAWVISTADATDEFGAGVKAVVIPPAATAIPMYLSPGGTLVTDFLDSDLNPTTEIVIPAGSGYIPKFQGPDAVETLWMQDVDGRWFPVPRYRDGSEATGGGGTGDVMLTGNNVHEYADSQSPPWKTLRRPNDNTDSNAWQNMETWEYYDNNTSTFRRGAYMNEKACLRAGSTTPSDVALRAKAHLNQSAGTPVFEVANDPNTTKYFQVYTHSVNSAVPIKVPYMETLDGTRIYFSTIDPNTDALFANFRPEIGDIWIDPNNP